MRSEDAYNIILESIQNSFLLFVVCIFCYGGYICRESDTDKTSTVLVMKNIEALADNEDTTNHACYGYGDIDCFGIKAKLRIDIFSLD